MSIYHLKNGVWADYVEEKAGILIKQGENWVDGASNEEAPPVSVHICSAGKFIQKYPKAHIVYTDTFNASGVKYTHSKSSSWDVGSGTYHSVIGGVWESGAIYTGWLGLRATTVTGGKGNVTDIENVKITYNRRGVGNWEIGYKIPLVLSNLTSASGTGLNAHNSKRMNTFYSDTNMNVCKETNGTAYGTTTMNNANAKNMIKEFLNGNYSILFGYKESTNTPYVGLYAFNMEVTYSCNIQKAIFSDIPMALNLKAHKGLSINENNHYEMWIYDDEVDMTYEEIMAHREALGREEIKDKDVIVETF